MRRAGRHQLEKVTLWEIEGQLGPAQKKVIDYLVEHANKWVLKDDLCELLGGVSERNIHQMLVALRIKYKDSVDNPQRIIEQKGSGNRFKRESGKVKIVI